MLDGARGITCGFRQFSEATDESVAVGMRLCWSLVGRCIADVPMRKKILWSHKRSVQPTVHGDGAGVTHIN